MSRPYLKIFFSDPQNRSFSLLCRSRSLSKFRRHLVNVKIVNIRHSNGHISCINKKKKNIFCRKKHHTVVSHVPNFQLSARSSSFFLCVFPSLLWNTFLLSPLYVLTLSNRLSKCYLNGNLVQNKGQIDFPFFAHGDYSVHCL